MVLGVIPRASQLRLGVRSARNDKHEPHLRLPRDRIPFTGKQRLDLRRIRYVPLEEQSSIGAAAIQFSTVASGQGDGWIKLIDGNYKAAERS